MENKRLEIILFSALFIILSTLTFFVFRPFLYIIILAAVLSVLFHPLYESLIDFFHGGRNVVAIFLVIVALVFLIIPIFFFGLQILGQAQNFLSLNQAGQGQYIQALQQNINNLGQNIFPSFYFNIFDFINKAKIFASNNLVSILSQTTYIFFQIFFLLFTLFFFLKDGEKILDTFFSLSPFEKGQNKQIINSVYRAITSVIRGTLFVGLIRFLLIATAFYFFGIPNALLWGSIGGIIGMTPGLGTPFAIIPATIYLLLYSNIYFALGMIIFGLAIFVFIDNTLSAYFFGKGLDVPAPFILFSILGGIAFFGPLGFIFGPTLLSLFISAMDMYKVLVLKR